MRLHRTIWYGTVPVMTAKDRWLDEGLATLADHGISTVRVDRIAARLGLTKGSFHHHFAGTADYRRCLLERYEANAMDAVATASKALQALLPEEAITALPAHASFDPGLEAAVRGWAFSDDEARAVQRRVDTARLDMLTDLWQRVVHDPERARVAALVPSLVIAGASVALPKPSDRELSDVFALLASLVPSVHRRSEDQPPSLG